MCESPRHKLINQMPHEGTGCSYRGVCSQLLPLPRNTAGHLSQTLFSGITIQLSARSKINVLSSVVLKRLYLRRFRYTRLLLLMRVGLLAYIRQLRAIIRQPPLKCYIIFRRERTPSHLLSLSNNMLLCRLTTGIRPAHDERAPFRVIISRDQGATIQDTIDINGSRLH